MLTSQQGKYTVSQFSSPLDEIWFGRHARSVQFKDQTFINMGIVHSFGIILRFSGSITAVSGRHISRADEHNVVLVSEHIQIAPVSC